uniref:Urotensin-2 (Fragments) n=1 Tax=Platichthys flesus TaxID=8260 RepID=UTS2_PLAFE|nr:RecName: Full=Urotensin-2; AltName: Full=Urotensin II; Short=U-II; Short=UII; Contains: RecName: Full=Urotensin-2 beta; Flags: Precursor [Platichthys flesus]
HPITESAEMPYPGPASLEERGVGSLDDLSLSEQNYPPQRGAGLRYATLEVLLEKQSLLNPFSRVFGIRKQFAGTTECFWKYCV